ncbi:hypothetical protein VT06_04025 [Arsukibacterium sp. MJ3]|uniref:hypothetical protein n=1 Tax=Arsukibacterium sp. MJ3 TaxID=1632859 RepID=UPI000626FDF2|nr:hypothetical protein [Arsukibacterium sp. MJ3]KKO49774.1 hypothetical protein VT06_04025 [Arsukibacterium sp. MJ3]
MNRLQLMLLSGVLLISGSLLAEPDHHEHHDTQANPLANLSLNEGAKWPVDEVLSSAMLRLRQQLLSRLDAIHHNRFSQQEYQQFAQVLEQEINHIVTNCQLTPETDAQFHLLLATLIQAKTAMRQESIVDQRQGAIKVLNALQHYPTFFQDEPFTAIKH